MAKIPTSTNEKVFPISKYLGVNENPDGDTHLKMGEASHMSNFRITDNLAVQKRQGSKNVAGLLSTYSISVATTATTVLSELNVPVASFTAYPNISVSTGGILTLSGTSVTVTYANVDSYAGYYYQNPTTGMIYQIDECAETLPATGTQVTGGSVNISSTEISLPSISLFNTYAGTVYSAVSVSNGAVILSGAATDVLIADIEFLEGKYNTYTNASKYPNFVNKVYETSRIVPLDSSTALRYGYLVSFVGNTTYDWKFKLVTATTESTDVAVRGIWSGYVNSIEYLVAAANNKLWSLTESGGVWTKTEIGTVITTNGNVHMFGFDKKLYILDGSQYRVWDGATLSVVAGYRPIVSISNTPSLGETTLLEQVNKLNGLREAWYSPDGLATTLQLPETGIASIDFIKNRATGADIAYTVNLTTGLITLTAGAYTTGTNTVKVGWTVAASARSQVVAMKFSETYNGETDTRVFLYGDGTYKAIYSGIDYNGKPNVEYFPDLYEMVVDSANTPITSMIKHYDQLITFKSDGAFITNYGGVKTLSDGTTMPTFYTSPLNRNIGNSANGQAVLVNNNPLTLFGRSVYEWKLSSYASKDERNADSISDRVSATLATFDLKNAICFDDNFHTEFYVVQNGKAVVYNYTADAWYIYSDIPATCMITYKQELYYGDTSGYIRHFSRDYMNDNGAPIQCYWESGSMDFGADFKRKFSPNIWLGIKPEDNGEIFVTVDTDRRTDYSEESIAAQYTESVASGFFSFLDLDFTRFSFGINTNPQMNRLDIKVKKFTYYKLIFSTVSNDTTATVTSADIRVSYTGNVR